MAISTVTSKGQVTIPKTVRDELQLRSGDKLDFRIEADGSVRIVPISTSVDEVYGCLASSSSRKLTVAEMDDRLRRAFCKKKR